MLQVILALLAFSLHVASGAQYPLKDLASYVNTLIGTLNGGHVFAGPSAPFGSIKPGLDSDAPGNQAGFVPDGKAKIFGISALHDSGTGGHSSLGMSTLLPQYCQLDVQEGKSGCKWLRFNRRTPLTSSTTGNETDAGNVRSAPGEFHASLATGIDVSFAASDHAAVFHFNYTDAMRRGPRKRENNMQPVLVFGHTDDLQISSRAPPNSLRISSINLAGTKDTKVGVVTRIQSSAQFSPSFGVGKFKVYTCVDIPLVRTSGTFVGSTSAPGNTTLENTFGEAGAIVTIDQEALTSALFNGVLPVRMGVSWVSTDAACNYASSEIPLFPSPSAFSTTAASTRTKWNDLLARTLTISHDGITDDDLTLFYSSLYRVFLSPNNVTGDNPRFETSKPSYDSFYCIWDSARTLHPLWSLLAPKVQSEVIEAMVEIQKHEGWLPDCRMSTNQGFTQGGSNAEMMLSDAYVKGLFSSDAQFWNDAFKAMLTDAQEEPADWGLVGRGGIAARAKLGYVPRGEWGSPETGTMTAGRTASRTIEYAFNDFSIALVAAGLRKRDLYDRYVRASNDTFNLWNIDVSSDGFSGFLQAREEDGRWAYQDPRRCSPALEPNGCFLDGGEGHDFYEASSWQYSFFAPHDMATVVRLMGGHERFVERYRHMWASEYADITDEPGFLAAYSANFAKLGYQHTVDTIVGLMRAKFSTAKGGLPGNDDVGAMGSLVVWTHLGFFPVAGTGVYLLSTPLVSKYEIYNELTGKTFRLETKGFDGARKNKYIVEARLDGSKYTRNWLCHDVFTKGSRLELTLGDNPSAEFGAKQEDLPPSLSTGGYGYDSSPLGC